MQVLRAFLALILVLGGAPAALADVPSCNTHKEFPVADLSQPVTSITTKSGKSGTEAFKVIGVRTIARYYDWVSADTTCKSLFPAETDVLLKAGFSIVTIFQHENSDPETFLDKSRGARDAKEALTLAAANGQPKGSMIYFAVDGVDQAIKDSVFEWRVNKGQVVQPARKKRLLSADPSFRKHIKFYERFRLYHKARFGKHAEAVTERDMIPFVDHYFKELNRVMKPDGRYRIGAYGSGMMCKYLLDHKLAERCWLAMSTGWPQSKEFQASGRWSLIQQRTTFCKNWQFKGRETARFDFSRVKAKDFGQWSKRGPVTPAPGLPASCKPSW